VFSRQRRWSTYVDLDRDLGNSVMGWATSLCSYRQVADNAALTRLPSRLARQAPSTSITEEQSRLPSSTGSRRTGRIDTTAKVITCDSTLELDAKTSVLASQWSTGIRR